MSCICIRGVEAFMVFYKDKDVMFAGFGKERFMVCKMFHGRLGYEHVHALADSIQRNGVVSCVGRENRNRIAWKKGINGGDISLWIAGGGV